MDTLILHTAETEAHARALMAVWRNRTPIHACATGGPAMSVGRHLLVVGILGPPAGDDRRPEQQLLDTLADQELAALLLLAPGRAAPPGLEQSLLPVLASTGEAVEDVQLIDAALRELGRTVVFGGAARPVFGLIGRPRAPKLDSAKPGARAAQDDEPEWAPPEAIGAAAVAAVTKAQERRSWGYMLGLGLGVLVVIVMLTPWALAVLRNPAN
jgi:hypothetical protein